MDKDRKIKRGESRGAAREADRRWSAVDTVIVLLALVVVVGIVLRVLVAYWDAHDEAGNRAVYYDVYFEIDEVYAAALNEIEGGDALYLYETGELLGYVGVDGSQEIKDDTTGQALPKALYERPRVEGMDEDKVSAEGVLRAEGTVVDGSLLVESCGLYLTRGTEVTVCTERVLLCLRVTDVVLRQAEGS